MSRRKPKKPPLTTSWRQIQQTNPKGKTTKAARNRSLETVFKGALFLFLMAAIVAAGLGVYYISRSTPRQPSFVEPVVVDIVFKTNGLLDEQWFMDQFGEVLKKDIRQIDVSGIKSLLEQDGQVSSAKVTVSLPSRLTVQITEREPILRVRVRGEDGRPEVLLIARDGTIYRGQGYPLETLRRLPGVAGLRVRRTRSGYEPITGMESIARLLDYAKEKLPSVYRHWRVVDLRDWDPEVDYRPSLVRIGSSHIGELVFTTAGIEEQIERLASILKHTQRYQMGQPRFIDLSYGEEVVIRYN